MSEVPIGTAHPGRPPCLTVQRHPSLKVKNRVFIFKINMNENGVSLRRGRPSWLQAGGLGSYAPRVQPEVPR